ncbi:hypothetical protein Vadar_016909 [Vaccinium darrowii]|uniref:Uncharacterized protein n=1 Tax=Vaccinium darrowii TaxID=229202 RepID=A0ACB7YY91_9ERIC|nr:hypothetical protein Vadar_016909 [Vaccinium darrowii]
MDCLANIFGRVGIESLLLDVPFVCKSWYKATLSPLCWQRLVFPKPSPYPRCYGSFNSRLLKKYQLHGVLSNPSFMKSAINRSRRSATMIALPSSCTEETLFYVAEECPDLKNLELPYHLGGDLMRKIPNLISKWKNLEHLRLDCSFEIPIIAQISRHCKNFHSLTVIGADIGRDKASAIVSLLPNIRYLDISYANIEKENLLKVLEGCKELVYFDVSKCITFKVDDELLKLGSRISRFKYG